MFWNGSWSTTQAKKSRTSSWDFVWLRIEIQTANFTGRRGAHADVTDPRTVAIQGRIICAVAFVHGGAVELDSPGHVLSLVSIPHNLKSVASKVGRGGESPHVASHLASHRHLHNPRDLRVRQKRDTHENELVASIQI